MLLTCWIFVVKEPLSSDDKTLHTTALIVDVSVSRSRERRLPIICRVRGSGRWKKKVDTGAEDYDMEEREKQTEKVCTLTAMVSPLTSISLKLISRLHCFMAMPVGRFSTTEDKRTSNNAAASPAFATNVPEPVGE